ncbi:hypothetical protein [Botrimarina colliarenosi]|uniref:hypothetical protein n=1 Tax=Botrimarina colliarenosi TaxID=2528001 RepID=UPI0011B78C1E|nr:hypothetical protein [Botrimarina colliarenosi]
MLPVCHSVTLALLVALASGCRPEDEVRTYRIAKPDNSEAAPAVTAPAVAAPPQGEPTDRMLGAIVPGPSRAWFFKAVGPVGAIDEAADAITEFLASIRFDGDEPTWETPDGWTESRAAGMRLATLQVPAGDGAAPIELSVIGLPLVAEWDAQVLDNVNRWRKQLKQPPLDAAALAAETRPLADVAEEAVLVDLLGWFDGGTMAPFAGGAAAPKPSTPPSTPPSVPPVAPPAAPFPIGSSELKSQTPDGWTAGPPSTMRKASLKTPGGAEVTAFAFPAAGAMGDRLANVNRWRGEVKLDPTTDEGLAEAAEAMPLLGAEGSYFELVGPDETTHAAMVERDGQVWFFKLRGPRDEVAAQRDAFRAWLGSLSL